MKTLVYPLAWASQVVLVVKNLLANAGDVSDTVQSVGWEDSLEEEMATHSSILAWRISWTKEPGKPSPWGHKELDMTEWLSMHLLAYILIFLLLFSEKKIGILVFLFAFSSFPF